MQFLKKLNDILHTQLWDDRKARPYGYLIAFICGVVATALVYTLGAYLLAVLTRLLMTTRTVGLQMLSSGRVILVLIVLVVMMLQVPFVTWKCWKKYLRTRHDTGDRRSLFSPEDDEHDR